MPVSDVERVEARIDRFIAFQENFKFLNDFDRAMRGRAQRLPKRESVESVAELAWSLYELCRNHFFVLRVEVLKLTQIAHGILWAIKAKNPTVQFSLTRGLLEHTAALAFQISKIRRIQDDLARHGDLKTLIEAIQAHQTIVHRIFYGQSPQKRGDHLRQFHINDCRESMRDDYPEEPAVYDTLSEFVHPNYGSNYLVSSGTLGKAAALGISTSAYIKEIEFANACAIRCLDLADKYETEASALLIKLDSRVEIASRPGERVAAVFSTKGLAHEGDGQTRDTAICFIKARSHGESVEMIYRYLQQERLNLVSPRQTVDVRDDFLYEVFPTDRGTLWVKTKMTW
jgi:hypothetical protein